MEGDESVSNTGTRPPMAIADVGYLSQVVPYEPTPLHTRLCGSRLRQDGRCPRGTVHGLPSSIHQIAHLRSRSSYLRTSGLSTCRIGQGWPAAQTTRWPMSWNGASSSEEDALSPIDVLERSATEDEVAEIDDDRGGVVYASTSATAFASAWRCALGG